MSTHYLYFWDRGRVDRFVKGLPGRPVVVEGGPNDAPWVVTVEASAVGKELDAEADRLEARAERERGLYAFLDTGEVEEEGADDDTQREGSAHFLMFPSQKDGAAAESDARGAGFRASLDPVPVEGEWLVVIAPHDSAPDMASDEPRLEELARRYGGRYDGDGVAVFDE